MRSINIINFLFGHIRSFLSPMKIGVQCVNGAYLWIPSFDGKSKGVLRGFLTFVRNDKGGMFGMIGEGVGMIKKDIIDLPAEAGIQNK